MSLASFAYDLVMQLVELGAFEVAHHHLTWPWLALAPHTGRVAFVTPEGRVATRSLAPEGDHLIEGPSFSLPDGLELPRTAPPTTGHRGAPRGLHGLALAPDGTRVALVGAVDGVSVLVGAAPDGEARRSRLDELLGEPLVAHAVTFDRDGGRLWLSADGETCSALALLDARTHQVLGVVRGAALPPPALHELFVHPFDDAVLLLGACGQDGTFARVAGAAGGPPEAVATALDDGGPPAGFVGFSWDGARVHLVEDATLRTHAWPSLVELSSVALPDDFASSYAGVVLGDRVLVDGHDADSGDVDRVVVFDRFGLRGAVARAPVPTGMWAGRLGADTLVTVEASGEPALARVWRLPAPPS